jgi:hypothetical protein
MKSLVELFCAVDDLCKVFVPIWQKQTLTSEEMQRLRKRSLNLSEIMTILVRFHNDYVLERLRSEFPGLVSYSKPGRAWENIHRLVLRLQLHLIFDDRGELQNLMLTPDNVDESKPVPKMARQIFGKLFGDKAYLSQKLFTEPLDTFNVQPVTGSRSNMKNALMPLMDKLLLRKRAIIETIIDQLKNIPQIEHSRHRSPINFLVNLIYGLIAYCHQPKKPPLGFSTLPALIA